MGKKINLIGERFGRLVVISEDTAMISGGQKKRMWKCRCDCGNETSVSTGRLRSGNTKSCGCLVVSAVSAKNTHDLSGQVFGRLTVLKRESKVQSGRVMWKCQCSCGNQTIVSSSNLVTGRTISCGCYKAEVTSETHFIHGQTKSRLYRIWLGMKERCSNPNHISYNFYGGRGISVCDEWKSSFETFKKWAMENGYNSDAPRGMCTIDRIDVNNNYYPDNCRWISMNEQNNNRRNSTK